MGGGPPGAGVRRGSTRHQGDAGRARAPPANHLPPAHGDGEHDDDLGSGRGPERPRGPERGGRRRAGRGSLEDTGSGELADRGLRGLGGRRPVQVLFRERRRIDPRQPLHRARPGARHALSVQGVCTECRRALSRLGTVGSDHPKGPSGRPARAERGGRQGLGQGQLEGPVLKWLSDYGLHRDRLSGRSDVHHGWRVLLVQGTADQRHRLQLHRGGHQRPRNVDLAGFDPRHPGGGAGGAFCSERPAGKQVCRRLLVRAVLQRLSDHGLCRGGEARRQAVFDLEHDHVHDHGADQRHRLHLHRGSHQRPRDVDLAGVIAIDPGGGPRHTDLSRRHRRSGGDPGSAIDHGVVDRPGGRRRVGGDLLRRHRRAGPVQDVHRPGPIDELHDHIAPDRRHLCLHGGGDECHGPLAPLRGDGTDHDGLEAGSAHQRRGHRR